MTYLNVEETINVREPHELNISIGGEIVVENSDISRDEEVVREQVAAVSRDLRAAIDDVLEEHAEECGDR